MVARPPGGIGHASWYTGEMMKETGIPLTTEHYINLLFGGSPPEHLSPEEEADLPEEFRRKGRCGNDG